MPAGAFFGVNAQILFGKYQRSAWGPPLETAAGLSMRAVRAEAPWYLAEPRAPSAGRRTFVWDWFDAVAEDLARRGLRWLPVLDNSAQWAASLLWDTQSPPRDPAEFAGFARAFAERYGRGGTFWRGHPELPELPVVGYQIWNEPNFVLFWHPFPDPARYADLYLVARETLRAVDPRAAVIVAGLSASGADSATGYLRQMYAARPALAGRVDALAVHPYDATPDAAVAHVVAFRRALDDLGGVDVPLLVTELGWPTQGEGAVTDQVRAGYLAGSADRLARSDCGIAGVMPHTLVTQEASPFDREHWFGIVTPRGVARESARAYGATANALQDVAAHGPVDLALCDRAVTVALDAARWTRAAGPRSRRMRCVAVRVELAGAPTAGASVRFRYIRGGDRRARELIRATDERGRAEGCFAVTRGRRPLQRQLRVTASRPDVVVAATITPRVLLP